MNWLRHLGLWLFGLIGFGCLGGAAMTINGSVEGAFAGGIGGAFAFAAVRLWFEIERQRRLPND